MHNPAIHITDEYRCPISRVHVVAFEVQGEREEAAHRLPCKARQLALRRIGHLQADHTLGQQAAAMFALTGVSAADATEALRRVNTQAPTARETQR